MPDAVAVSVIVPAYNAARYIKRALSSLCAQTLNNLEIIVVDDASSDDTSVVIDEFKQEQNASIVYLRQDHNRGPHDTRLAGLQMATGQWIGFVDADDTVHPDMFNKMYQTGLQQGADIVICGCNRVSESGEHLRSRIRFSRVDRASASVFERFCKHEFGSAVLWNKLYRREVIFPLRSLCLPWRQDVNEDYLLNIGCFLRASVVCVLPDMFYNYTDNPVSVTSSSSGAKWFVAHYRAYALAVSIYPDLDHRSLESITELYRDILGTERNSVDCLDQLLPFDDSLQEALKRICEHYPLGPALLTARLPVGVSLKKAINIILQRVRSAVSWKI